jgi:hypothetical protein
MDNPAFWPINTKNRNFLNLDEKNKILVIERSSDDSNYLIVINLSSWVLHNYKIGVKSKKDYELMLNSDLYKYAGFGLSSLPNILKNNPSKNFEVLDRELELSKIGPYQVIVLKRI